SYSLVRRHPYVLEFFGGIGGSRGTQRATRLGGRRSASSGPLSPVEPAEHLAKGVGGWPAVRVDPGGWDGLGLEPHANHSTAGRGPCGAAEARAALGRWPNRGWPPATLLAATCASPGWSARARATAPNVDHAASDQLLDTTLQLGDLRRLVRLQDRVRGL